MIWETGSSELCEDDLVEREPSGFGDRVRFAIGSLGPGEVTTYGEIAAQVGRPGAARAVGRVLANSAGLPWWRVVTVGGRLVPGMEEQHARRLAAEGIAVSGNRVVGSRRGTGG